MSDKNKAVQYTEAQLQLRQRRLKRIGRYSKTILASWVFLLFGVVGFMCYIVYVTQNVYALVPVQLSIAGLVAIGYRVLLKKEQAMNNLDLTEDYDLTCDDAAKIFNPILAEKIESDTKGESTGFDSFNDGPGITDYGTQTPLTDESGELNV